MKTVLAPIIALLVALPTQAEEKSPKFPRLAALKKKLQTKFKPKLPEVKPVDVKPAPKQEPAKPAVKEYDHGAGGRFGLLGRFRNRRHPGPSSPNSEHPSLKPVAPEKLPPDKSLPKVPSDKLPAPKPVKAIS